LLLTAYNVGFGDALLLSIPDRWRGRETVRHILIDTGNALAGPEGSDTFFRRIAEDILGRLDGRPVDLYVMTHEHMDHVRGLQAAQRAGVTIPVEHAWLTASSAEDYGVKFPEARQRMDLYGEECRRIALALSARGLTRFAESILTVNNTASTKACVGYLRTIARKRTYFVYRGFNPHPFREVKLSIWGPEQDTSDYYPRLRRTMVPKRARARIQVPPGVERKGFYAMLSYLQSGIGDNLLAIDRAANNTSVVMMIEWRGMRLLFPGDAELKSWRMMDRYSQLKPVHFLKLSHHGSINGAPPEDLLEKILPQQREDGRKCCVLLSAWPGVFDGVPDAATLRRIGKRVDRTYSTRDVDLGKPLEIRLEE
jgi:hypothetical protein